MDTGVAFVSFLVLFGLALVAALFSCYHAQQRRNFHMAQQRQAAASGRPATLIISRSLPASLGAFRGVPLAQQLDPQVWVLQHDLMGQQRGVFHGYRTCTGKTPTPPSIIQNLPVVIYEHPAHASDEEHRNATEAGMKSADATAETCSASTEAGRDVEEGRAQCVICCCEYQTGELVKLLPCLHTFHEECIDAWLHRDHTCPICQADVILAAGYCMHDWSSHPAELEVPEARQQQRPSAAPAARVGSPATPPATPLQLEEAAAVAATSANNSAWQAVQPQQQQQQHHHHHLQADCRQLSGNSMALPVSTRGASALPAGHFVLTVAPTRPSLPADEGLPGSAHS